MKPWLVTVTLGGSYWSIQVWQPAETAKDAEEAVTAKLGQLIEPLAVGDVSPAASFL